MPSYYLYRSLKQPRSLFTRGMVGLLFVYCVVDICILCEQSLLSLSLLFVIIVFVVGIAGIFVANK